MEDTVHWYQSRTIWSTLIATISGLLALSGHAIDEHTQSQLVSGLSETANGLAIVASIAATYYRTQAVAGIKGTSSDPAVYASKTGP